MKHIKTLAFALLLTAIAIPSPTAFSGEDATAAAYRRKAEAGDQDAQFELGLIYHNGSNGVAQNFDEAMKWYKLSADQGNLSAMNNIGVIYVNEMGQAAEGFKWVERAALAGDSFSQRVLGMYYRDGVGVPADGQMAASWFGKSCIQGEASSCFSVGYLYHEGGEKLPVDFAKAREWYERGAEMGNAPSLRNLGFLYYEGKGGLEQDFAATRACYEMAARQGDPLAQLNTGRLYLEDRPGVGLDEAKAKMWLFRAAENGMANDAEKWLEKIPANVKPHDDAAIRVAADDLIHEFARDAKAANAKYRGRLLEVARGGSRSRVNMVGARADIRLTVADSSVVLNCVVVGKDGSISLNTGSDYGYRGVCEGMSPMLGIIIVNHCENVRLQ